MRNPILALLIGLAFPAVLPAQIVLGNFDDLANQAFTPFNGNWNGGAPLADQFVQHPGFVSITSVNGGDPKGDGSFDALLAGTTPIDFSLVTELALTARIDPGNQVGSVVVEVRDSAFNVIGTSLFFTASMGASFSQVTATFNFGGGGIATDATYWRLAGDGIAGNSIRMSFDELSTVPEPATGTLAVLGLFFLLDRRRRSH